MLCAVHDTHTHTHLLSLTKINPLKPVLVAHWNLTLLQIPWFTYPPSIQFQIGTFQLYRQEVLKYKYLRNPIVISLITMRHNFIHRLHCCKKWLGPPRCGPTVTMKPVNQLGWCSFQIHLSQCTENTFVILARKHNPLAQWERRAYLIKVLPIVVLSDTWLWFEFTWRLMRFSVCTPTISHAQFLFSLFPDFQTTLFLENVIHIFHLDPWQSLLEWEIAVKIGWYSCRKCHFIKWMILMKL